MPDREEFLSYVNECLKDDWEAHEDFQHSTIDFNGPDDESNIKCDLPEEHASLTKMGVLLQKVEEVLNATRK
jgi:hypothetical protein